jgi:putative ABC transport system permease protein
MAARLLAHKRRDTNLQTKEQSLNVGNESGRSKEVSNSKLLITLSRLFNHRWAATGILIILFLIAFYALGGTRSIGVWLGAIALGISMSLVAVGVYITFRSLNFPDLTIDGSFVLGAAITATMLVNGYSPYSTLLFAFILGAIAGACTSLIATGLRMNSLLASIIVTTALFSINLRIMGRSNIPLLDTDNVLTPFAEPFRDFVRTALGTDYVRFANNALTILLIGLFVFVIKFAFDAFMHTEVGLALQATGDNPQMMRSLGRNTKTYLVLGVALSNGLTGLSGSLFAQYQGFADVNMGLGLIIAGLAAVILGETLIRPTTIGRATLAAIVGMVVYRIAIAAALTVKIPLPGGEFFRIDAQDVKLATALLVLLTLWLTRLQSNRNGQANASD